MNDDTDNRRRDHSSQMQKWTAESASERCLGLRRILIRLHIPQELLKSLFDYSRLKRRYLERTSLARANSGLNERE
ncbi:hypothetical protein ACVWWG_000083 [Bradyrhizobium sp. LB7.2]